MSANIALINERKAILENARSELKKSFFSLDEIIDKIIDSISLWYIDNTLLERAPIICLWGPTGVGKTDLIKKLIRLLKLSDQFYPISMNTLENKKNSGTSNFGEFLFDGTDFKQERNVIMLDEFQWFNSKDEDGSSYRQDVFGDIWDFLSEREIKKEIISTFTENLFKILDQYKEFNSAIYRYDEDPDFQKNLKKNSCKNKVAGQIVSMNDITILQRVYFSNYTRKELSLLPFYEFVKLLDEKKNSQDLFQNIDCRNYLIILSGNIDQAYPFCHDITTNEIDADYYHSLSKRINVMDIKNALQSIFKDEHIARMGNSHIIFPTISKDGYEKIIKRYFSVLVQKTFDKNNIKIELDNNIYDMIYSNSVCSTQGARPLFTTINDFFNNVISNYILWAIENKVRTFKVGYNMETFEAFLTSKKVIKKHKNIKYVGDIDKIKVEENSKLNEKIVKSVHEAGHIIAYSILNNIVPNKVSVATSSNNGGVVTGNVDKFYLKQYFNHVKVCFAGMESEKIVFGNDNISTGGNIDVENATMTIATLVRKSGIMNSTMIVSPASNQASNGNTRLDETNEIIISLCNQYRSEVKELLEQHKKLIIDLSEILFEKNVMNSNDLHLFFKDRGFDFVIKEYGDNSEVDINAESFNYINMFKDFKNTLK